MDKLHFLVGANAVDALRQERGRVSLVTHLLLDEFVRLFGALLQLNSHFLCSLFEASARHPIGQVFD